MSKATYRKIVVNDIEYRWIAGREATKVQNRATGATRIYKNSEWATPHLIPDWERLRRDEAAEMTYYAPTGRAWIVGPGDVRGMIIGVRKWVDHPCESHPERTVTGLCYSPFYSEIKGKTILADNCPQCMFESWMNT